MITDGLLWDEVASLKKLHGRLIPWLFEIVLMNVKAKMYSLFSYLISLRNAAISGATASSPRLKFLTKYFLDKCDGVFFSKTFRQILGIC